MLQLLLIVLFGVALLVAVVVLFVKMGWGFFQPRNNIEAIVQRGEILDYSIRGDVDYFAEKGVDGKMRVRDKRSSSLLFHWFGVRYFGLPFICKIGKVLVSYPPQIKSVSGHDHKDNEPAPGFTVHHNYLVIIANVEFQGGISLTIGLNLEVVLTKAFVAWGRNGQFLAPLGQCIEGAVKVWARDINATDFIGRTQTSATDKQTMTKTARELCSEMCKMVMGLNINTNEGNGGSNPVRLEDLCGYEIHSVSYNDYEPGNPESMARIKLLEEQNETIIQTTIAEQKAKTAKAEAEASATRIEAPGLAQARVNQANGIAQAEVDKARGLADVVVLKAKVKAVGPELIVAELNADAIRDSHITTYVVGGNSASGVPPIILSVPPATSPKPDEPKPKPVPKPTTTPPAPTPTPTTPIAPPSAA